MSKLALIIVAHPDDEVIGVGGTILKLQKEYGYEVRVEFMTTTKQNKKWDQAAEVSEILNVEIDRPHYSGTGEAFTPLELDGEPITNIIEHIEDLLETYEPEIVFTHHIGDLNQDHRIVSEAVLVATRPFPGQPVKKVYTFDTASSTEWSFGEFPKFEPNVFIDITEYFNIKMKALMIYEEEIRDQEFPHPRSIEALTASSKLKGSVAGVNRAETFRLVRSIDAL